MADTAGMVIAEAKSLLNDNDGIFFTTDKLLPYLNKAYRELQDYYNLHGLKTTVDVAGLATVPAGAVILAAPPADMLRPIFLSERAVGSTEQFIDMDERSWEPDQAPAPHLGVWVWREEVINFLGATTDRQIRVRYVKSLSPLTGEASFIGFTNAITTLAARTGALAARFLGENPTRADELDADTGIALDRLIVTAIRQNQGMPTRRQRTRYRVPN